MATLKGDAALALHRRLKERNTARRAAELSAARAAAWQQGKEDFDLRRLEALCDTGRAMGRAGEHERRAHYEYLYYVECGKVRTLQEFARIVTQLASWE